MAWLELSLVLPKDQAEQCETLLNRMGALAVSSSDAGDTPVLEPVPGSSPLWDSVRFTGLFELTADLERLSNELCENFSSKIQIDTRFVEAQNWSETWRMHAQAYKFGDSLWVVPTDWRAETNSELEFEGALLRLDPGLAFGTGSHPTTNMCLAKLAKLRLADRVVVDYGCGSGILAVAAILLGARKAFAVDYDDQALISTRNNATVNGLSTEQVVVLTVDEAKDRLLTSRVAGDAVAGIDAVAENAVAETDSGIDVVIANILQNPLLELSGLLSRILRLKGQLVLSGILEAQADQIIAAYPQISFEQATVQDGWVCMFGVKTGD